MTGHLGQTLFEVDPDVLGLLHGDISPGLYVVVHAGKGDYLIRARKSPPLRKAHPEINVHDKVKVLVQAAAIQKCPGIKEAGRLGDPGFAAPVAELLF